MILKSIIWKRAFKHFLLFIIVFLLLNGLLSRAFVSEHTLMLRGNLFYAGAYSTLLNAMISKDISVKGYLILFLVLLGMSVFVLKEIKIPMTALGYWSLCLGLIVLTVVVFKPWESFRNRSGIGRHDKRV